VPALEKNLQDRDDFLKFTSAWALVRIDAGRDGAANECLEPLIKALTLPDPRARSEAALSLGLLGRAAKSAVPALREALRDDDATVQKSVGEALEKISR
jgi:HEAT repeat protein